MVPGRFIVLMYHNLSPVSTHRYSVGIDDFKAQLEWLRTNGFTVDGFRELQQRLTRRDFPERYVVITFDDGHKSNLVAARILREFGAQATFFLTKLVCQTKPNFMDDDEIVEVAETCSVGSHGVTHLPMSRMDTDQIRFELRESKEWLEGLVGCHIESFSVPGGNIDSRVVCLAREAGYRLVASSVEWWNDCTDITTTYVVNRVEVPGSLSLRRFGRVAQGDQAYLWWRRFRAAVVSIPAIRSIGVERSASAQRSAR